MSQRIALLSAAGITAFVLVVLGGVVARSTAGAPPAAVAPPATVSAPAQAGMAADVPAADPVAAAPLDDYPVSLQLAAMIAGQVAPGARLTRAPELVDYQGAVAYEFSTDLGLVYVDANTGQVLYNGVQSATHTYSDDDQRRGDQEDHDEHGEYGDDD